MLHHSLLQTIRSAQGHGRFLYPFYEGYSIANIIPSILNAFTGTATSQRLARDIEAHPAWKKRIKLLLVTDGFGYNHFLKYAPHHPLLQRLEKHGEVYPLTSVFPSTTAAALTSLHTGLTPQEHGLPEWLVYFEEFNAPIHTLPFRPPHVDENDSLVRQGGTANMLYEGDTAYEQLQRAGIPSYVFLFHSYVNTTYSQSIHRGSTIIPFSNGHDLCAKALEVLRDQSGPAYLFLYWGTIDSVAHSFGPESPEHMEAISEFARLAQTEFVDRLSPEIAEELGVFVTADHGHVNIKRDDIINLNKYPLIEESFATNEAGEPILPTGSPHDVFLFIRPAQVPNVLAFLQKELDGRAAVMTTAEAIEQRLFGLGKATERFLRRIGSILILPYPGYHVWYEFLSLAPFSMLGIHGGLSEEEMIVPFVSIEGSALLSA